VVFFYDTVLFVNNVIIKYFFSPSAQPRRNIDPRQREMMMMIVRIFYNKKRERDGGRIIVLSCFVYIHRYIFIDYP
jgi:hypothetical protein